MNISDVKRLMGCTVKVTTNGLPQDADFTLTAYVYRRLRDGRLIHQLIVEDRSGAEYWIKMGDAHEIPIQSKQVSQQENDIQGAQIRQQEGSGAVSVFGTTYEAGRNKRS